ncbi:MAG TPA: chemotaxis protein CheB [Candidatus Binatia bacterium]|jgi:two-component system CheB/CheR fusion protein
MVSNKKMRVAPTPKKRQIRSAQKQTPLPDKGEKRFFIVGMGASAGGLKAFEEFFSKMPPDSGMAFVLIPHLDPGHVSMLPELLRKYTQMDVVQVKDGAEVDPNTIYVLPPNRKMAIMQGRLILTEPTEPRGLRLPIDTFFRSLAEDQESHAIAVVLSGTGTDGTLGLRAIKEHGGFAIAQDAGSAEYNGMPQSAIQTGLLDYVLAPEKIGEALVEISRTPHLRDIGLTTPPLTEFPDVLEKLFRLLRTKTGHDFSVYKKATIYRRVGRRMGIHKIESPSQYLRFLEQNADEVTLLERDLLISVTQFFRDPEAFEALRSVIEAMLAARSTDSFRVWVPGCATGEEVYSIAMILRECMDKLKKHFNAQIFGTDVDVDAIATARAASYPLNIANDVTPERLARFFVKENNRYTIIKDIREMALFSTQDLLRDPPFTKLDLLSCRNVLIYLDSVAQQKLLRLFHYALRPGGVLFLGSSETVGDTSFTEVEKKWKIFKRQELPFLEGELPFPVEISRTEPWAAPQKTQPPVQELHLSRIAERLLLDRYAPACVVVNSSGRILYTHGATRRYLELPQGEPNLNLLEMAHGSLKSTLASLMTKRNMRKPTSLKGVRVKANGGYQLLNITAIRHDAGHAGGELRLILFEPAMPIKLKGKGKKEAPATARDQHHMAELQRELREMRQRLQATIDEMQSSNEELKSYNEEVQSVNEELQSTNEELESSKEELQSLNEELATVNAELQRKLEELTGANDDMENLIDGTKIATLFLDGKLQIKRFTPEMTNLISLVPGDVGRPLSHFKTTFLEDENLSQDSQEVLNTLVPKERQVKTTEGLWYLERVVPYRTTANVIDGVVATFTDITRGKRWEMEREEARKFAESVVETVREPLVVLDMNLNVLWANRSFYEMFKITPRLTERQSLFELQAGLWDIPELRRLLENVLPENKEFENFRIEHDFVDLGRKALLLNARKVHRIDSGTETILLAIEDVTDRPNSTT